MSLFLGKIHYWLFNKIQWFEGLEREVIALAEKSSLDVEALKKEITAKYGEMTPNKPLEEMIDTSNIHGWLQGKIHAAEGRMAAWTNALLGLNDEKLNEGLKNVYIEQGIKAGMEVAAESKLDSAEDIYSAIEDYVLDGMPCDRVNEVTESSSDKLSYVRTICVHKDVWAREDVDVKVFYDLRKLWIENFVKSIKPEFTFTEEGNKMTIERR